jgi:DNA topoisomerase I
MMMRTRRVDPASPGYSRRRRGRGFQYLDEDGTPIRHPATLARLRSLAVPPAWSEVWITPDPNGHLQAVGSDAAGRRQYLYHDAWRARRDLEKFDRVLDFARSLPRLRRAVEREIVLDGLPRERVLACAARLLDVGLFRIGGEEYAAENGSVGLATLERRHVRLEPGDTVAFSYPAKGRTPRRLRVTDADVRAVLDRLMRRRSGCELLAYRNGRGWVDVRSPDINEYIKAHTGDTHSAKDFRTWHATVLAAVALAALGQEVRSERARQRVAAQAVREVSRYLGNTPAVCRRSYIDPRVFDRFRDGRVITVPLAALGEPAQSLLRAAERRVLKLLSS